MSLNQESENSIQGDPAQEGVANDGTGNSSSSLLLSKFANMWQALFAWIRGFLRSRSRSEVDSAKRSSGSKN